MNSTSSRSLLAPPIALAALLLWAPAAPGAKPPAGELREVEVKSVVLDPRNRQPIVLLEEKRRRTLLPIWIGPAEAQAIAMELNHVTPPRPMTHDLLRNVIGGLKGKVVHVVITELKGGTFYAFIHMKGPERSFSIDSRPSDAIALALRVKAPIFVRPAVMRAGVSQTRPEDLIHRKELGLVLQEMTPALARFFGGGKEEGLLVSQVVEGAPAARAGLRRGDVIIEVERRAVESVESFEQAYVEHPEGLTLSVRRGPGRESLSLRLPRAGAGKGGGSR